MKGKNTEKKTLRLKMIFKKWQNTTVTYTANGLEALETLKNNQFSIVLMDIQMPVMDGLETTQIIRANARWADLPIIALTANTGQHYRNLCQHTGMNDFLAKPINPDMLINTLLKWLVPRC